jgi:IclR family KDG regulon transcriptional repressor
VKAKSAERVLDILELLASRQGGLTQAEIAHSLEIPVSSASILCRSLVARRYAQPDGSGRRLVLGVRAFETGSSFVHQISPVDSARPVMEGLSREFGQTCHLAILDGRDVVYLDRIDPPRSAVQLVTSIGSRIPAARTAVGRAQLAFLSDGELAARFLADTVAVATIEACREEVRRSGWAAEYGLTTPGIGCVAAPVFGHAAMPVCAIGLTFLEAEASGIEQRAGPRLVEVTGELSRTCGFTDGAVAAAAVPNPARERRTP